MSAFAPLAFEMTDFVFGISRFKRPVFFHVMIIIDRWSLGVGEWSLHIVIISYHLPPSVPEAVSSYHILSSYL